MIDFRTSRWWSLAGALAMLLAVTDGTQDTPHHFCPHSGVSFDGRCYWVSETKATWWHAHTLCHRLYGENVTLVTIKDEKTNRFIDRLIDRNVWIGLHEAHGENEWRWVDNTPVNGDRQYRNWKVPLYPTGTDGRNCAVMYKAGGQWRDVDCKKEYRYVCNQLSSEHICPQGGIFFHDRCYWSVQDYMPFSDANRYCRSHFGDETRIAVSKNHRTNLFLSRLIYPGVWLGLHDKEDEGDWRWVDDSPLRYSNWRVGEPNNVGHEDCAVLAYGDGLWNDQPCGRGEDGGLFETGVISISSYDASHLIQQQPAVNGNRFVCAIPTCYDPASDLEEEDDGSYDLQVGSGVTPDPDSVTEAHSTSNSSVVCLREECSNTCVDGSVCGDTGECICTKEFPEMVCDTRLFDLQLTPSALNASLGGNFTLKCQINLPSNHILGDILWSHLPAHRSVVTHFMHRGYSLLEVAEVHLSDATEYRCAAIFVSGLGRRLIEGTAVVSVGGSAPGPGTLTTEAADMTTGSTPSTPESGHMSELVTDAPLRRTTIPSLLTTEAETGSGVITDDPSGSTRNTSSVSTGTRKDTTTTGGPVTEAITNGTATFDPKVVTTEPQGTSTNNQEDTEVKDETGNTVDPGPPNDSQSSSNPRDGRMIVAIVLLSMFVCIVLAVVIALLLKLRMKRNTIAMSRLIELNERN